MSGIYPALAEEAFYVYRTGGEVWVSSPTVKEPQALPKVEKGDSGSVKWLVEHTKLFQRGVNGPLTYWTK